MSYAIGTMVIDNSGTVSSVIAADPHFQRAQSIMIAAPAAVTGTITVQSSYDGGSTYNNHQSGSADITVPQGDTATITVLGPTHFRVKSGSSESGDRTFTCRATERDL